MLANWKRDLARGAGCEEANASKLPRAGMPAVSNEPELQMLCSEEGWLLARGSQGAGGSAGMCGAMRGLPGAGDDVEDSDPKDW